MPAPTEGPEQFASSSWAIEDVQAVFDVTDQEARAFLAGNEKYIRDAMNEAGWRAIESLGREHGFAAVDDG